MKGFLLELGSEARKLWRQLTVPQRVSLVGIGAAAAGLLWILFEARAVDFAAGGAEVRSQLLGRGLSSDLETPSDSGRDENGKREDGALSGLFETPWSREQRDADSKRHRMEDRIAWNPRIRKAGLEFEKERARRFGAGARDGSALVTLSLAPGVECLSANEAEAVRQMVCAAYNLEPGHVTLTDNLGRLYDGVETREAPSDESDQTAARRVREEAEKEVRGWISDSFAPEEYRLLVRVEMGQPSEALAAGEAESQPGDRLQRLDRPWRHGGLLSPGTPGRIELRDGAGRHSRSEPETTSVYVWLTLDLDAVLERLRAGGVEGADDDQGTAERVEAFRFAQKGAIETLLLPRESRVAVVVQRLEGVDPAVASATGGPESARAGGTVDDRSVGESSWDWLAGEWTLAVLVGGVLLAAVAIGGLALRSAAVLPATRRERPTARGTTARPDTDPTTAPVGASAAGQDSLLSVTERMSEWVQRSPQTAASVLRVWLAESTESVGERGGRP